MFRLTLPKADEEMKGKQTFKNYVTSFTLFAQFFMIIHGKKRRRQEGREIDNGDGQKLPIRRRGSSDSRGKLGLEFVLLD